MKTLSRLIDTIKTRLSGKHALPRVLGLLAIGLIVFVLPEAAHACGTFDVGCYVGQAIIKIFELLAALMGYLLVLEVSALISVAQYANFVSPGPTVVQIGWVVTRDLANMFFIVFMLVIAFSTVIGGPAEKYSYRSNLQKLLVMAVVINFSKTIVGLLIDMSQVLMLTFVNGFKDAAAGNFLSAFQIQKLLELSDGTNGIDFGLVLAMMLAFILAAIAACVVLIMLVMMTFRIVMLWILIIFSPIAFLTSAFPMGSGFTGRWWGMLKQYLVSGPIIAFFLWLALASAQRSPDGLANEKYQNGGGFAQPSSAAGAEASAAGNFQGYAIPSRAGRADTILSLVIMTCIMFAGLKFAAEDTKVIGSGFAKQVKGRVEGALNTIARAPDRFARDQVSGAFRSVGGSTMKGIGTGLARVPLLGGVGRRLAARGEQLAEGRRAELEKRWVGSAKDLAKYNPGEFGSKMRVGFATAGQIKETAEAALANPKAMEALKKSGGAEIVRDRLKAASEKDPAQKGAYDNFMKANWDLAKDAKEKNAILGKFSGEEARKYMSAPQMTEEHVSQFGKNTLTDILANGKGEQQAAVLGAFSAKNASGELGKFMKERRMTYADIPAEAYAQAGASGKSLKLSALEAAEKDPALMRRFTEDAKMRDQLAPVARDNFAAAVTDIEKAQKLAILSQLGGATAADFGSPPAGSPPGTPSDIEVGIGQLSAKALNDLERSTPTDNPAAQAGLAKILEAAVKNGSTDLVQAIQRSPNLSTYVPLTVAREAEKSTGGYSASVNSAANTKLAELDRRRRDAASSTDPGVKSAALGIADDIEQIREAMDGAKKAARELAAVEKNIATLRENFADHQKGGRADDMAKVAAEIKTALKEAFEKKEKLAKANDRLKEVS